MDAAESSDFTMTTPTPIGTFEDILAAMENNPSLQAAMRQHVLDQEFLQLPATQQLLERLRVTGDQFSTAVADMRADALDAEPDNRPEPALERVLGLADAYLTEISRMSGRRSPRSGPTGEGFATWVSLLSASDRELTADLFDSDRSGARFDLRDGAVTLATFHAAKGLQWHHVVIAGVEDGLVPLRRNDPEERRLFYVAVSRAARTLHFTWARHRSGHAADQPRSPSPWLAQIAAATAEPPPLSPDDAASRLAAARAVLDSSRDR